MKPTPEQIKAARLEMPAQAYEYVDEDDVEKMLNAAAEVAEKARKADLWKGSRDPQVTVRIADRPAADCRCHQGDEKMTGKFKVTSGVALVSEQEFENFRLKIIDECAKAAKEFLQGPLGEQVAKVILALKDKP